MKNTSLYPYIIVCLMLAISALVHAENRAGTATFSIGAERKVCFAQGNVQYSPANGGTWRMADNQYDVIGKGNNHFAEPDYTGWLDLIVSGSFNPQVLGSEWRLLSRYEMDTLLNRRPHAAAKRGVATIEGVNGWMLLPDTWTMPDGLNFVAGTADFGQANVYSATQWQLLENAGAVFLPANGFRRANASTTANINSWALYQTTTAADDPDNLYYGILRQVSIAISTKPADYATSVRLVRDANYTLPEIDAKHGAISGANRFYAGDTVQLVPVPQEGYHFAQWEDGSTSVPRVIVVQAGTDYQLGATFRRGVVNPVSMDMLPGAFSVSPTRRVRFAKGNLQYTPVDDHATADGQMQPGTWRLAEEQYDVVGKANITAIEARQWIDLFCWGHSGYCGILPTAKNALDIDGDLLAEHINYDPAYYNAISNGGYAPGMWRMLTMDEVTYLIKTRPNAADKMGAATIGNVCGWVLLPDTWTLPDGLTFVPGGADANTAADYRAHGNNYSSDDWHLMQAAGAVFLPAAGNIREGATSVSNFNTWALYQLSTAAPLGNTKVLAMQGKSLSITNKSRATACSIRPVHDYDGCMIYAVPDATEKAVIQGGGLYQIGETAVLEVLENNCFTFLRWSDGNTDNPRTITVTEDAIYVAEFETKQFELSTAPEDENLGSAAIELIDD